MGNLYANGSDPGSNPYRFTPEQIYIRKETLETLHAALAKCPPRNRVYLLYRYGFEDGEKHSLKEAAAHFHLNRSSAKKTEKDGLNYIRKYIQVHGG